MAEILVADFCHKRARTPGNGGRAFAFWPSYPGRRYAKKRKADSL